jgi:hypothetical protein
MKKPQPSFSKKTLIGMLILATTMAMSMPPQARAMLAPADNIGTSHSFDAMRGTDLQTIQTALESKVVRQRLMDFNLTPEQIDSRLSKLSDEQIHQTAMQIRTVNPGGDSGMGLLGSLLVIGILVLLFIYLFKRV